MILLITHNPLEVSQVIVSLSQLSFCVHFGLHTWTYGSHFSFSSLHSLSESHPANYHFNNFICYTCAVFFWKKNLTLNTHSFGSITSHLVTITFNILCTFWSALMIIWITCFIYSFTFTIRVTPLKIIVNPEYKSKIQSKS